MELLAVIYFVGLVFYTLKLRRIYKEEYGTLDFIYASLSVLVVMGWPIIMVLEGKRFMLTLFNK